MLFAALLRRAGVAPTLLPLLAEPARAAVQGLGILARRRHPGHTAAFLASLREICAGTSCDARLVHTLTMPQKRDMPSRRHDPILAEIILSDRFSARRGVGAS